jgi:alkyldihydroxyacetonephosphate synthase
LHDELAALIGSDAVSTDEADLLSHGKDWTPRVLLAERSGAVLPRPHCVVRPASTEQVSAVLRWADEKKVVIVPFGGGSSVSDGIGAPDAVVLDTGALSKIHDIDAKSRLVRVGSGVMGPHLAEALAKEGFTVGHEPQSFAISSVGGWVATRACGQLSARYGGIEDIVLGLEAVLPGGDIVRSKTVPRRAVGPDVAALMIGSEGTLGVVTEATLKISPPPEERTDVCIRFEHMVDGVAFCREIAQSHLHPTVVRLYDKEDAFLFLRSHPDEEPGPLAILSFDGPGAGERARSTTGIGGVEGDPRLVAHWWAHRNDAVGEFKKTIAGEGLLGPHGIVDTMEVSGTWTALRGLYHSMKEKLSAEADLVGCHLSHIYPQGACLYFTLASATPDDATAAERLDAWWETGMETCLEAGGSISHHHGIGRLKSKWLPRELGGWYSVLQAVKRTVDPHGIMNPGALGL